MVLHALIALLLFVSPAGAVFTEDELDKIDSEILFDSEYFLDLRGFSYPTDWDEFWNGSERPGYRINGASLDCCDLFLEQEARMATQLNDWFSFSYNLEHRGDKDVTSLHNWIALSFGPFADWSFTLFGEPKFAKENADIGLRIRRSFKDRASIYVAANAVDFNFNKRGRTTQRYDKKPFTYDLGGDLDVGFGRAGLDFSFDSPIVRRIPDENRVYKYRKTRASLRWRRTAPSRGDWDLSARYNYHFKRESDDISPDPSFKTLQFHRRVYNFEASAGRWLTQRDRLETGADYLLRVGESDYLNRPSTNVRHKRWEVMPYGRWRRTVNEWGIAEAALFLSFGERRQLADAATSVSITDSILEAKLGLGWDFVYGQKGRLGLYGTFDLDDAGRHIWDGGNIRAMFLF
jgi:hypothetical protein